MKLLKYSVVFLIINFLALYLGNLLMANGPRTDWYKNLNQASWTPPGWVFGAAWTIIMICFSIYMAWLYDSIQHKVILLFSIQFILNVIWNYVFFNQHLVGTGLIVITLLTAVVTIFLFKYFHVLKYKSLFIAPYFIWLCIATSLNMYIYIHN
ncbi:tryptophan-rich sensory protein [Tamlana fucoidanivorans]|uniref:Tryptophan-rich sensory protein n=1 Tax=Allotamlana fucoidanivorans TaxID=2583814 RepID=A0A5C4SHH6_9FLAO|nr:TspO/MBR family protein [Tamlana fucoidanivorans]TNJ42460.1 tryptophan-rich sensory protein [Tamlana fucoidanivorans]